MAEQAGRNSMQTAVHPLTRCSLFFLLTFSLPFLHPLHHGLTVLGSIISPTEGASQPRFACQPPVHSSYSFCNASLPIPTRANSLIAHLTLDEKIRQLSNTAAPIPRLGVPGYQWWSESLHGIDANGPGVSFNGSVRSATNFPQVILMAASLNRTLWSLVAQAIAVEARAMYNVGQAGLTFWAPNVNIFRDPRWGRGQETPGEDPMLSSAYAIEYVRGFQGEYYGQNGFGEDHGNGVGDLMLSACCKHYTAYDLENWGNFTRETFDAKVTDQDMEDTFQPPFHSCIHDGHASCLMCSYNAVNGIPSCARHDLLQKVRKDWGFDGYITSDCDAVATIFEYQHYSKTPEDAAAESIKAGVDIDCGTYLLRHTKNALELGKVQVDDIDRALFNLFSVQLRLGLFDSDPSTKLFGKLGPSDICTTEHRKLALEAARQGIVLLQNNDEFLPLMKTKLTSIAIVGPAVNNASELGGDYTGSPCNSNTLFEALHAYAKKVSFATGCLDVTCNSNNGFEEAERIARDADAVVVVVGLDLTQETETLDRVSLLLPGKQMDLVTSVAHASKVPIVLVLIGGGPIDVSFAKKKQKIASILWIGYPGEAGGQALAEVIFGEFNPGGRLPVTWYPESFTNVPMNDMHMRPDPSRGYPGRTYRFYTGQVVYGFGHGLSYSNYSYELLSAPRRISLLGSSAEEVGVLQNSAYLKEYQLGYIHIDEVKSCEALRFQAEISVINNGRMDGGHVVMLFTRSNTNMRGSPRKKLIGFMRVPTTAYRATKAEILVDPCVHLSSVNEQGGRILTLGEHVLLLEGTEYSIFLEL